MKKMNHNQKSWIVIGLCLIVLFMAIGYASFSTSLVINGTSTVTSNWDVQITNIEVKTLNGSATKAEDPSYDGTSATFKTNLVSPGDSMTYEVTISNNGDIPAKLEKMTVTDEKNPAILFQTTGLNENDVLGQHSTATLDVTVQYNPEVQSQPENLNSTLKVVLDYVQNK